MRIAHVSLALAAAAFVFGCIDSNKAETKRSVEKLTKMKTYGVADDAVLAHTTVHGELIGEAAILRDGKSARVVVDVHGGDSGHYEAVITAGIACRFDPTERAGGASAESTPSPREEERALPTTKEESSTPQRMHAQEDGPILTKNPLSIGELDLTHSKTAHLEATFKLEDLAVTPASRYRDDTIQIRRAGRERGRDLALEAVACGRFLPGPGEPREPQG